MHTFNAIVERDPDTGIFVGSVPGSRGLKPRGSDRRAPPRGTRGTLDDLEKNVREVIAMLLEDGDPKLESEFVGLQTIRVA